MKMVHIDDFISHMKNELDEFGKRWKNKNKRSRFQFLLSIDSERRDDEQ